MLDGGKPDPLLSYERAFVGAENEASLWRRNGNRLALRFPDPLNRTDTAGRIIPHDFVVAERAAGSINSVGDGVREIWPLVADIYARVWDSEKPPSASAVQAAMSTDKE